MKTATRQVAAQGAAATCGVRLAEIAERLLLETDVWDTQHSALNALRAVGDERSVAVLEACRGKISATDMVDAYVRHIRRRVAT